MKNFCNPQNPLNLSLLQQLAKGSLEQIHNLTRALRLWALLRWLYSEKGYRILDTPFTYNDWRKAFFTETHQAEKQADILKHQDPNCACSKTIRQWLLELEVPLEDWLYSLQQIPILNSDLEKLLGVCLFAQVRKTLQSDLDLLVSRNYLQRVNNVVGRSKYYCRVDCLAILDNSEPLKTEVNLPPKTQAYIAGALGIFSFLDPTYPLLAEQMSEEVDEDNHRVFLYVDYVVPESTPKQDAVDEIQSELQEIWNTKPIAPILIAYHSAHQNQIKECTVYPVCIYFMERAKYLCAYGSTPRGEISWYKYRLDRIVSEQIEPLDWQDPRVPQLLRKKHEDYKLPTPKTVNDKLNEAWGCDFYKEKALMILRFEQDFHQRYIKGISIHNTLTAIDYRTAITLTNQHQSSLAQRQSTIKIIESRPQTDAYYQVYYRVTDYYVVRWLRALGSKVEVLHPWDLRQEMTQELQNTWHLYQTNGGLSGIAIG